MPQFATYIALGDSINGCCGTPFPQLLLHNDDAAFPAFRGHDLSRRYGLSALTPSWVSGSDSADLVKAVDSLPSSLPGPVLVTIVVGGNDLRNAIPDILQGKDQTDRDQLRANLAAALDALTAPGRFGPGVQVYVYETDIYDPSDGRGNWATACGLTGYPVVPTDGIFDAWNSVITSEVPKHGMHTWALSLHDAFYGHGFNASDDWFAYDCIHPNQQGSNQVRRLFWNAITGEDIQSSADAGSDAGADSGSDASDSGPVSDGGSSCDPNVPGSCGLERTCCPSTRKCCGQTEVGCCVASEGGL